MFVGLAVSLLSGAPLASGETTSSTTNFVNYGNLFQKEYVNGRRWSEINQEMSAQSFRSPMEWATLVGSYEHMKYAAGTTSLRETWLLGGNPSLQQDQVILGRGVPGSFGSLFSLEPISSPSWRSAISLSLKKPKTESQPFAADSSLGDHLNSREASFTLWYLNTPPEEINNYEDAYMAYMFEDADFTVSKHNLTAGKDLLNFYLNSNVNDLMSRQPVQAKDQKVKEDPLVLTGPEFWSGYKKELPYGGLAVQIQETGPSKCEATLYYQAPGTPSLMRRKSAQFGCPLGGTHQGDHLELVINVNQSSNFIFCVRLTKTPDEETCLEEKISGSFEVPSGGVLGLTAFTGHLVPPEATHLVGVHSIQTSNLDSTRHLTLGLPREEGALLYELDYYSHLLADDLESQVSSLFDLGLALNDHLFVDQGVRDNRLSTATFKVDSVLREIEFFKSELEFLRAEKDEEKKGTGSQEKYQQHLDVFKQKVHEIKERMSPLHEEKGDLLKKVHERSSLMQEGHEELTHYHNDRIQSMRSNANLVTNILHVLNFLLMAAFVVVLVGGSVILYIRVSRYEKKAHLN